MTEVGGDAAAYLDPEDIRSAAHVLRNVLNEDDRQRCARVERGFANAARHSTEEMITSYLALYDQLAGKGV